jgi:hypothetical protein
MGQNILVPVETFHDPNKTEESHDRSVSIALGYVLDDWGSRVQFLAEAGNFSLHHQVQHSTGAHPASYQVGARGSFPGGRMAGAGS